MRKVFLFVFVFVPLGVVSQVDFTSTSVCQGNISTLSGSSSLNDTSITAWNWDLNEDSIYNDAVGKTISYTFPKADTFQVGLSIDVKNGNDDTTVKSVIIYPKPQTQLQGKNVCQGEKTTLSASTTLASGKVDQYKWDFNNDDTYDKVSTQSSTTFFYGSPGRYTINILSISNQGCENTAQTSVEVFKQPTADFSVGGKKKAGEIVKFKNNTITDTALIHHYLWFFGDGHSSVSQGDVRHKYDSAGTYNIQLVAVTNDQCRDTTHNTITVDSATSEGSGSGGGNGIGPGATNTSHILTPNGDGVNEKLQFEEVRQGQQCRLVIFNRWNQLIYQTDHYQNNWEGTKNNAPLEAGAYYYRLNCGDSTQMGNINILK